MLRLIAGGLFDRYPDLQSMVGHAGEALPGSMAISTSPMTTVGGGMWTAVGMTRSVAKAERSAGDCMGGTDGSTQGQRVSRGTS